MNIKQLQQEFIKQLCRGRNIVVSGESALIFGYGKPCATKTLNLGCHREYDLDHHIKKFASKYGLKYEVIKDTPTSFHVYFKDSILITMRIQPDTFVDCFRTIKKDEVYYQCIDSVLSSLLSLYSLSGRESTISSIEWILRNHLKGLDESTVYAAHLFAEHKGWDSVKELLQCEKF